MRNTGTAVFSDKDGYLKWYSDLTIPDAKAIYKTIRDMDPYKRHTAVQSCAYQMFETYEGYYGTSSGSYMRTWAGTKEKILKTITDFLSVAELYDLPLHIGEWHDDLFAFLYMGNPEKGIIVPSPEKYLQYIPEQDYSNMSPAQVRASLALPSSAAQMAMIPGDANSLTQSEVAAQKAVYEDALKKANQEMENIRNANTGELATLQAEIQKLQTELNEKKESLMQELRKKMADMEAMKEDLENQIYLLDAQIYAIRCFAGEVVKFTKICNGKAAAITVPIVIHQKLHFLDEDMGRLASIYDIQWNQLDLFENFLKHSPIAQETFVPNERCVSLVRLSKDGKTIGENNDLPFQNLLKQYDYYHGKTIGIIIRNGENIYVGWTDEKRINIEDDLILSKPTVEISSCELTKSMRKRLVDGIISRSFVYNILQGVVEHTPILPLPAGVQLNKPSDYVIYAVADQWITDNRFGSFNDIIERCNKEIQKDDKILTVQHLIAEHGLHSRYNSWENVRGRGEANRTHDVHADDCTIYSINLVEYDPPVRMIRYKKRIKLGLESREEWYEYTTKAGGTSLSDECVILEEYDHIDRHVFISLKKRYSYSGEARANFEIYENEYINLTYLNSVWLEWVVTNKTLGGWTIKNQCVNYAYAIRYLKKALDYVRKRELLEKALLDAIDPNICSTPEWQVMLSEWKLEKRIRKLTPYQAKRFAKHLNTQLNTAP